MDNCIQNAIDYLIKGNYKEANNYFEFAIQNNIALEKAYSGKAICLVIDGELDKAEEVLKSQKLGENVTLANLAFGLIQSKKKNFKEAEKYIDNALSIEPENAYANYMAGTFFLNQGQFEKSITFLNRAKGLESKHWQIYVNLASAYIKIKNFNLAFREIYSGFKVKPKIGKIPLLLITFFQAYPALIFVVLFLSFYMFSIRLYSRLTLSLYVLLGALLVLLSYWSNRRKEYLVYIFIFLLSGALIYLLYLR